MRCWRARCPAIEGPVYIDFADSKSSLRAWLAERGFAAQRPLTRMLLGRASGFDDASRTFAVARPGVRLKVRPTAIAVGPARS